MKRLKHLIYSIRMGILIFRKPEISQANAFQMIGRVFESASECKKNNRPMSFACQMRVPEGDMVELFEVWIGVGDDTPIKRNQRLLEEISFLKKVIKENDKS